MSDETLDNTASAEEQPVDEAVATETPGADATATETPTDASSEQPSPRLWAGKYKSPEEIEHAYLESQREASRMAGELSALRQKAPATPESSTEPKWKALEAERNKWAQHLRNTSLSDSERYQADEQVRLYDREIAKQQALHEYRSESRRESALHRLDREAMQVLTQYKDDLADMSTPLYQAASQRLQDLLDMGSPDNNATRAMAVAYAAAVTGASTHKVVQQDRKVLLKTLNQQAKQAVVAGAGGPTAVKSGGISAKEIENMTDAEFLKYERERVLRA